MSITTTMTIDEQTNFMNNFSAIGIDNNGNEITQSQAVRTFAIALGFQQHKATAWGERQSRNPQLQAYGPPLDSVIKFLKSKDCYGGKINGDNKTITFTGYGKSHSTKKQTSNKQFDLTSNKRVVRKYIRAIAYGLGYNPNNSSGQVFINQHGNTPAVLPSNADDYSIVKRWVLKRIGNQELKKLKKKKRGK